MPKNNTKRILVVNDSPVVLAYLADAFADEFEVVTADSGEDAVEFLESIEKGASCSNVFDLIITDLNMPGMDGFGLADYVRGMNKTQKFTPVIMLTSEKITKEEARSRGCAAYISKANKQRVLSLSRILLSR